MAQDIWHLQQPDKVICHSEEFGVTFELKQNCRVGLFVWHKCVDCEGFCSCHWNSMQSWSRRWRWFSTHAHAHIHTRAHAHTQMHTKTLHIAMFDLYSIIFTVVWRNDLLIHTILLDGFILLESFVTPAGISMGIKLRTEFFPCYE